MRPLSQTRRRQLIVAAGPATVAAGLLIAVVVGMVTMSIGWAIVALLITGGTCLLLGVGLILVLGGVQALRLFRR